MSHEFIIHMMLLRGKIKLNENVRNGKLGSERKTRWTVSANGDSLCKIEPSQTLCKRSLLSRKVIRYLRMKV